MQAHQYAMGSQTPDVVGRTCDTEKIVPDIGIDDSEMSYRRGYQHGAAETFRAVRARLDQTVLPSTPGKNALPFPTRDLPYLKSPALDF
jgi:hypothetical protein